ncbi:hypothetical protein [Paenibacillus sp. Soil787]|uniref:hypothetical protein n=1 Tax=Paenibacillus sp. Soil787 TaxID=1736411 RepID=UPI000B29C8E6|nr:hypothetical protein [Paenibacillus sp. Soil787]
MSTSSGAKRMLAAARFSLRKSMLAVPGIGSIRGEVSDFNLGEEDQVETGLNDAL